MPRTCCIALAAGRVACAGEDVLVSLMHWQRHGTGGEHADWVAGPAVASMLRAAECSSTLCMPCTARRARLVCPGLSVPFVHANTDAGATRFCAI
eukprot:362721-Chlamydomonas_euryale.AAC.6